MVHRDREEPGEERMQGKGQLPSVGGPLVQVSAPLEQRLFPRDKEAFSLGERNRRSAMRDGFHLNTKPGKWVL